MKGANYIPPDMFMPRALKNPDVYYKTIQDAVNGNYNMLRVSNIYNSNKITLFTKILIQYI